MASVLEYTRQAHESKVLAAASSSRGNGKNERTRGSADNTDFDQKKHRIVSRIAELDAKVESCKLDMNEIRNRMEMHIQEKDLLERQLAESNHCVDPKGKGKAREGINYMTEPFDWSAGLKARMKAVFGIHSFRLCQEG